MIKTAVWLFHKADGFKLKIALYTALISIVSLTGVWIAILSKQLVDAATEGNQNVLINLLIVYGVLVVIEIALVWINALFSEYIWQRMSIGIRKKLFKELMASQWLEFTKRPSGDYLVRIREDVADVVTGLADDIPSLISSFIKFVVAFSVLLFYQPYIAIGAFVFSPFAFLITRLFAGKIMDMHLSIQAVNSSIDSANQEYFQHIQVVKSFELEDASASRMMGLYRKRERLAYKNEILNNNVQVVKSLAVGGGYLMAYGFGLFQIFRGEMTFGVLIVFLQLFNQIHGPLSGLVNGIPSMAVTFGSAERVMDLENMPKDPIVEHNSLQSIDKIRVKGVTFGYSEDDCQLQNINCELNRGEVVLVMGQSGSGKTTLIRLILALMEPRSGVIQFMDKKGNTVMTSSDNRDKIAYVPQGNSLFSGTIATNLRQGKPDADDSEIIQALEVAEAWPFVSKLKEHMDTPIGERGIGLSEGQAQRICIARALIKKAPVVIFDEATSGLDQATEERIMNNIRRDYKDKLFIVVTHRENVKNYADRVLYIADGGLIER